MFTHILVPVSQSEKVERALEIALELARQGHSKVALLHVIELIRDAAYEEFRGFYDGLKRRAERDLEAAGERLRTAGVALEARVVYGQRVSDVVAYARENGVDLIVMQSHPVEPANPARGWGTISYKVAILAPCPVMLVK